MNIPDAPTIDLSQLPPPVAHEAQTPPPPRKPRKRLWLILAAVLVVLVGAAGAVVLVQTQRAAAEQDAARDAHASALTEYDAAWTEFDRANNDLRENRGLLSATSLNNAEEVVEAINSAIDTADSLERETFASAASDATIEDLHTDTKRMNGATSEVQRVTATLTEASEFFNESRRAVSLETLRNVIADAEETLSETSGSADPALTNQLEDSLADAEKLAADPAAHPNDLRITAERLHTLLSEVRASAGPNISDVDGTWAPDDILLQNGGFPERYARGGEVGHESASLREVFIEGKSDIVWEDAGWVQQDGCLKATATITFVADQLWFCPAGTPVPTEAHAKIYTLDTRRHPDSQQVENLDKDRLIEDLFMYRQ